MEQVVLAAIRVVKARNKTRKDQNDAMKELIEAVAMVSAKDLPTTSVDSQA
jgi:hypothetical protein